MLYPTELRGREAESTGAAGPWLTPRGCWEATLRRHTLQLRRHAKARARADATGPSAECAGFAAMLGGMSEKTGPQAILFADLGGSTQLYETLGDREAQGIIAGCLDLASEVIGQHRGRVVKTIGDEVMATFPRAEDAMCAALGIIASLRDAHDLHGDRLGAHVGFHVGPVIEEQGDLFGDTVNVAARMVSLAVDGEILTTREVSEALPPSLRGRARRIDRRAVRGKREDLEVFQIVDEGADVTSMYVVPLQKERPRRLVLRFGDERFEVGPEHPTLTIGRAPENDVVLPVDWVSRRHAHIALRKGKFVLFDESSNGTLLQDPSGATVLLMREDVVLPSRGSFGVNLSGEDAKVELPIHFEVVEG
jgi:adenylate cyclase